MPCCSCKYYSPSLLHPNFGLCTLKNKPTFYDNCCDDYIRIDIYEAIAHYGRVYCLDCKTWVYEEEAELHKDHRICIAPQPDEFIHEEARPAD